MKVKILSPFVTYNGPVPVAPKVGTVVEIPTSKAKALVKAGFVEEHVEPAPAPAPDPAPVTPASEPSKPATSRQTKATAKAPENKTPDPADAGTGD